MDVLSLVLQLPETGAENNNSGGSGNGERTIAFGGDGMSKRLGLGQDRDERNG